MDYKCLRNISHMLSLLAFFWEWGLWKHVSVSVSVLKQRSASVDGYRRYVLSLIDEEQVGRDLQGHS